MKDQRSERLWAAPPVRTRGPPWRLVFLIAVLTGVAGVGLEALLRAVEQRAWPGGTTLAAAVAAASPLHRVGVLLIAGVVTTMVRLVFRSSLRPGLLTGLWEQAGVISLGRTVGRSILAAVDVGLGAALGREGPLKEIGGAIASYVAVGNDIGRGQRRLLVACGTAAGLAAAYNVPLGGALFGLEVLLGRMEVELVGPMIVCCAVATAVARSLLGNEPSYEIPPYELGGPVILVGALLFGVVLGGISALLLKGLRWFSALEERSARLAPFTPFLALGSLGVASAWWPQLLGNGYGAADAVLHHQLGLRLLVTLPLLRFVATATCQAAQVPGGLVTPVLSIGALTGGLVGEGISRMWPGAPPGAFALLGMGALFAGTTRGPISSAVLIFELSRNYQLILPLACACGAATLVSRRLETGSLYRPRPRCRPSTKREPPGIPVRPTRGISVLACAPDLLPELLAGDPRPLFVVDGCGRLAGALHPETARRRIVAESLPRLLIVGDLMDSACPRLSVHTSCVQARALFAAQDAPRVVPVVDDGSVLVGEVWREDAAAS